jgi:hypothetical protein
MRKLILSLLAVAVLSAGSAFAQSGLWAGASVGFPGVAIHFGVENISPGLDLRVNAGSLYDFQSFSVGVDALYGLDLALGVVPLETYAGGGLSIGIGTDTTFGVGFFGGIEYRLFEMDLPEGGVFLEVGPALEVTPVFNFGMLFRAGFNYHF